MTIPAAARHAGLLIAVCVLAGRATAQAPAPPPSAAAPATAPATEPLPPGFDPAALGLDPDPIAADALGLWMHLPAGSRMVTERAGGTVTLTVQDSGSVTTWSMRIQELTEGMATPTAQIEAHLDRLTQTRVPHTVLTNESVRLRGREGRICWVRQTASGGEYATGWLVMPSGGPGSGTFLLFSMLTTPAELDRVRRALDTSFRTIEIRPRSAILAERERQLLNGAELLRAVDRNRLSALLGRTSWYRIYRRADPTANTRGRELGYSRVEIVEGKKGRLNPGRREMDYDATEHELGLLVTVQGRIVIDSARHAYYDTIGLYWVAWDQRAEQWSVRATHREGDSERSESETGIRNAPTPGDPQPRLTVIRSEARSKDRKPFEWSVPGVYLSHGLSWIIGDLLPREPGAPEQAYAWYTYQIDRGRPTLSLRFDTWGPGRAGPGTWAMTTRLATLQSKTESLYDQRGTLIRRTREDRTVTEPVDPNALRRLWSSQGLRLGGDGTMIARRLIPALALVVLAGCAASKPRGLDDAPLELFEIQEATVPLTAESIYSFDAADRRYNLSAPDFAASSVHRRRATARFEAQCQHDEDESRSEFWARDDEGNIVLTASIDYTDNAVTAFQPPLIIAWKELQPGDERESNASMRVLDLQRLSRQVESGTAKRRVRYVADQRIRTPLGEFVAHRYDVHFSFSLRKAEGFVRSTLFIVPGMGPVAEVRRGEIRILSILPRNMEMLLVLEGVDAPADDAEPE